MGKLLLAAACLLLQFANRAEEPTADPIAAKITAAKEVFYAERDKAELALIALLEKKEATAKQAGDLKTLEAVRAESDAFRKEGKLPKAVPVTAFEAALKTARTKLENTFLNSIKTYTQKNDLEKAKALQAELNTILQPPPAAAKLPPAPPAEADPLQVDTVWVRTDFKLTITQRQGETFTAHYKGGRHDRIVMGKIAGSEVRWDAKDSQVNSGAQDSDHVGKLSKDDKGWKIEFTYYDNGQKKGSFTQRLQQ